LLHRHTQQQQAATNDSNNSVLQDKQNGIGVVCGSPLLVENENDKRRLRGRDFCPRLGGWLKAIDSQVWLKIIERSLVDDVSKEPKSDKIKMGDGVRLRAAQVVHKCAAGIERHETEDGGSQRQLTGCCAGPRRPVFVVVEW